MSSCRRSPVLQPAPRARLRGESPPDSYCRPKLMVKQKSERLSTAPGEAGAVAEILVGYSCSGGFVLPEQGPEQAVESGPRRGRRYAVGLEIAPQPDRCRRGGLGRRID